MFHFHYNKLRIHHQGRASTKVIYLSIELFPAQDHVISKISKNADLQVTMFTQSQIKAKYI